MRYLIDPEFRVAKRPKAVRTSHGYCSELRRDLSRRNIRWALDGAYAHEVSMGHVPAVLYREDEHGQHGNFLPPAYRRIQQKPAWARRLTKVHTSARRSLLSHDPERCELDSSNSSDALLMNIFCHPATLEISAIRVLLGIDAADIPIFGYRPRIPLLNGGRDCTEIDMKLGDLLIEAKLTEYDFQTAPRRLAERYRDLEEVFDLETSKIMGNTVQSYQLVRGVLAAHASSNYRFCVLCDARRPDLIGAWHRVLMAVKIYDLRSRLQILTWQELARALPGEIKEFLEQKSGITSS